MSSKRKFNKVLLVEGNDDRHVMYALRDRYEIKVNFDVTNCEGIEKLFDIIPVQFKSSANDTIGVVIDADVNVSGRWQRVRDLLINSDFENVPENPPHNGLIIQRADELKVGVWIMPDNSTDGMLEDFLKFLIPADDVAIGLVDNLLEEIEDLGIQKYSDYHKSKVRIHVWLGLQESPGTPLGQSITKRYLELDNELSDRFKSWLQNLFGE